MPTPPKAKPVTLDVYLQHNGIPLEGTYLHVIRDPNASRDWNWALERSDLSHPESLTAALIQVTRFDTCHNRASLWTLAKRVVVLIDVAVKASPIRHLPGTYLFMGVLTDVRRRNGLPEESNGHHLEDPGWEMSWMLTDGDTLFRHPGLSRGYKFLAVSDNSTAAATFTLLGAASTPVATPTPDRLRGFQLSLHELQERIQMPNWRDFLNTAGVYLIQVRHPATGHLYRYVGKAGKNLGERWEDYAESGGTGGSSDGESGNIHLVRLRKSLGPEAFAEHWRIQVLRVCDSDETRVVEKEMKEALCSYHPTCKFTDEKHRSPLGLNGN